MLITTNTIDRRPIFQNAAAARIAIEKMYTTQHFYPFFLYGFVIMEDHCHFLVRVPEDGSISKIMNTYKRYVSMDIGQPVWQKRFHIRTVKDAYKALEYIHQNPVKAGLCEIPVEYPWSSASGKWDVAELEWWHM